MIKDLRYRTKSLGEVKYTTPAREIKKAPARDGESSVMTEIAWPKNFRTGTVVTRTKYILNDIPRLS